MSHLQKFQTALASLELDGALISSEINQRYLCDFPFSDGYLLITPERAYLLTDSRYIEAAKESVRGFEILLQKNTMTDTLAELISEEKISRLVLEEESVSYSEYQRYISELPRFGAVIDDTAFSDRVTVLLAVKENVADALSLRIRELSNGNTVPTVRGKRFDYR